MRRKKSEKYETARRGLHFTFINSKCVLHSFCYPVTFNFNSSFCRDLTYTVHRDNYSRAILHDADRHRLIKQYLFSIYFDFVFIILKMSLVRFNGDWYLKEP